MADMRRFQLADVVLLLLVLGTAAGTRAGYLAQYADNARSPGPLQVQDARPLWPGTTLPEGMPDSPPPDAMRVLIHNVQRDLRFAVRAPFSPEGEQTAHVSPGYPWLVGLLGRYVPTPDRDMTVRWIQAGLGTLTAGFYFLFARRAFRSLAAGTVAGLFAALHPFWIINVAAIDDGTLASFALAGCLFLGSQAGEKGGAFRSLLLGVCLAGLSLVRAAFLPFSFVVIIWYLLRSRTLNMGGLCAVCAFLGFVIGLAPWTVRNYQLYNEPVPVVTSTYLHLWVGNNPNADGGPANADTWQAASVAEGQEAPLSKQLEEIPSQLVRFNRLGKEVVNEIQAHPEAAVRRRMMAALYFVFGKSWFETGETVAIRTPEDEHAVEMPGANGLLQGALFAMLVLAFLGWRWSYGWRWESVPAALALMWVPIPYILGHAENLSGPRLPLDGALLTFAAFALCCFFPGVGRHLLSAPGAGEAKEQETAPG